MRIKDFKIGVAFSISRETLWRCTDVGTRTITGINLYQLPRKIMKRGVETVVMVDPRIDTSYHNGPPYACAEYSFDEYDLEIAEIIKEENVKNWRPKK